MPNFRKKTGRKPRRIRRAAAKNAPRRKQLPYRVPRPLAYSKGPFPKVMQTQLVYKQPSTTITSNGLLNFNYLQLNLNSMWDLDITNVFGNKQPLFFDQLVTTEGPYKKFKVNAWKTTFKFINLSDKPMYVYYDPGSLFQSDSDTVIEIENRRGVISKLVTAQSNASPMATISKYTTLRSVIPQSVNMSENFMGTHSANPSTQVYGTLFWKTLDGSTTAFSVGVQITHVFYCQLYDHDSVQST